jgi:hypothetical protein
MLNAKNMMMGSGHLLTSAFSLQHSALLSPAVNQLQSLLYGA